MQKFKNLFQDVPDPRADNTRHDLVDVLVIALAAVLCGADNCADMAEFGCAKEALLRQFLRLEHGIPSHDTFSRIFRLLDPQAFEPVFRRFLAEFAKELHGVVAVDGKALRGAFERGRKTTPLQLVNVWGRRGAACDCPTVGAQAQRGRRSIGSLGAAGTRWLHCHRRRAALPRRVCPVHSPPWRTIRFGAQGQPIGAVYRRADTAGAAGRTSAGTATSYRQPWPRRTAPSGGRACGRTRAQARLPWNQSARTYRAADTGRRCRGATNCSIFLAVETVVASARAGNHPRPLGYREPAALGPRRRLRRGPRPQPQGPRTGEPRHSAQAGTQYSPLASEHRVHTPQNQTRRGGT